MSSLKYKTTLSGEEILRQLYLDNREDNFFTCEIKAPSPQEDTVEDGTLSLEVKRIYDSGAAFEFKDVFQIYLTRARFEGDSEEFEIAITIYSREADIVGATVSVARRALEIFDQIKRLER